MEMPPPSAVALLLVRTTLSRVRLWLPWSRMPPPLATAPSALTPVASKARPFWMVKPTKVSVKCVAGLLVLPGLMSKTRAMPPPSTATTPPLVFWMVRLPSGRMANSPAWLSLWLAVVGASWIL
jgi:hypothetical protein